MKKILVMLLAGFALCGAMSSASAHGWRGDYGGGWHGGRHSGWVPFAAGAIAGAVVVNAYSRPGPVYYAPYYQAGYRTAAYCPENGLYYPQTQACPSGWQRVPY